jgi:hypothetical protein
MSKRNFVNSFLYIYIYIYIYLYIFFPTLKAMFWIVFGNKAFIVKESF